MPRPTNTVRLTIEVNPEKLAALKALPVTASRLIRWFIDMAIANPSQALAACARPGLDWASLTSTAPLKAMTPAPAPQPTPAPKPIANPAQTRLASLNLTGGLPPPDFVPPEPKHHQTFRLMGWQGRDETASVNFHALAGWLQLDPTVARSLATPDEDGRITWEEAQNLTFEASERESIPAVDRIALTDWLVENGVIGS